MTVTVSVVVFSGILLFVMLRHKVVGAGAAFVAGLFGFYLSRTSAADAVDQFVLTLAGALH